MNKLLVLLSLFLFVGCKAKKEFVYRDRFHSKVVIQRDTIIVPPEIVFDGGLNLPELVDGKPISVEDSTGQTKVTFTKKGDSLKYNIETKPSPIQIEKVYIKEKDTVSVIEQKVITEIERKNPWYFWPLIIAVFAIGVYLSSIVKSIITVPFNIIKSLFK